MCINNRQASLRVCVCHSSGSHFLQATSTCQCTLTTHASSPSLTFQNPFMLRQRLPSAMHGSSLKYSSPSTWYKTPRTPTTVRPPVISFSAPKTSLTSSEHVPLNLAPRYLEPAHHQAEPVQRIVTQGSHSFPDADARTPSVLTSLLPTHPDRIYPRHQREPSL